MYNKVGVSSAAEKGVSFIMNPRKTRLDGQNKKITILCILEILKEYSDENNPLTQGDIVKKLESLYGFMIERKSVAMNIDSLIDFGYDIVKHEKGGCYLDRRGFRVNKLSDSPNAPDYQFAKGEIAYLIDAVFSSKNISLDRAKTLALCLSALLSNYEKKFFRYIHSADSFNRSLNEDFFYNVEKINEAIEKGKKISFVYNIYGKDGKLVPRHGCKPHIVNPYFFLNVRGTYFLICNNDKYNTVNNYKVELITSIKILCEDIKLAKLLDDYDKIRDRARYANERAYLFSAETITATLRLDDEWAVSNAKEWFGNNIRIVEKQTSEKVEFIATLRASEDTIVYWSLQFGESVEVLEPASTRERVAQRAMVIAEKYKK